MNKRGASKGKTLVIALDSEPTVALTDKHGFLLCFDTFAQISDYCFDHNLNLDSVLVDELDVESFQVTPNNSKNFLDIMEGDN